MLTFSRAPRVPDLRHELRRARAAQLLVQLAVRRVRARATASARAFEVDPELVIPNPDLSLDDGAIAPWARRARSTSRGMLESVADELGIDHRRAVGEAAEAAAEA